MKIVNIHDAKSHFSRLLRRVQRGEEIVIAKAGTPLARLVPVPAGRQRVLGSDRGAFTVPPDFDAPPPEQVIADFER